MFTPQELSWFESVDTSAADVIRGLRKGSALDCTFYNTTCTGCGQEMRQPLRWFQDHQFRCACGAQFDSTELGRYMTAMMLNDKETARAVSAVEVIEYLPDIDE